VAGPFLSTPALEPFGFQRHPVIKSSIFILFVVLGARIAAPPLVAQDSAPEVISRTGGKGVPATVPGQKNDTNPSNWASLAELKAAAARGEPAAMAQLGEQLLRGDRVPQDGARAVELLEKAARSGEASAAFRVGMLLDDGDRVPQDRVRALAYFRAAAAAGNAHALHNIGAAYAGAHGVKRNYPEALGWLILAKKRGVGSESEQQVRARIAKLNHPEWIAAGEKRAAEIERELTAAPAVSHLPPPAPLKYIGPAVGAATSAGGQDKSVRVGDARVVGEESAAPPAPADATNAMGTAASTTPPVKINSVTGRTLSWPSYEALEHAAETNEPNALAALGQVLLDGKLAPANPTRAVELLERAAQTGSADAAQQLAEIYTKGRAAPADPQKAFQYGLQAARAGVPIAMFNVGALLANGRGTEKNFTEALAWLITAKRYGIDRGSEQRIREYLASTKPGEIPVAEKRAGDLQREIDAARNPAP
jgi:uncharacterized protein